MTVHRKAVALMDPIEAVARLAARAQSRAEAAQTRASGSASYDNGDGTRTIIGPQAGSGDGAPSGQAIATHVGDVTPPPIPTGIRAWSGDGSLHVLWAGSLDGDVPADFDHVTILVGGVPVAEMRSAGSVTVDGLAVGSTVSVTATAEDDACLADGTPAHNVSAPSAAVKVEIRDVVAEVKADADAFKASAEATYSTKTEVDEKTKAITESIEAVYLKEDDASTTYATKTELSKSADGIRSEVSEEYVTKDDAAKAYVGKSTFEQLASSIRSLVKGESTYTDPDGQSATSGIYSLVTQTRDAVTALFGAYTKTTDLASTQAVRDAKKAGTDAQATADAAKSAAGAAQGTANGAKSTADSLATLIREDSTGITVGKSADGKTYSTGRTRMTDSAFQVLDKAGTVITQLASDGASFLSGLVRIVARKATLPGNKTVNSIVIDAGDGVAALHGTASRLNAEGYGHTSSVSAGWEQDFGYGVTAWAGTSDDGIGAVTHLASDKSETYVGDNMVRMTGGGFDISHPEYLLAALMDTKKVPGSLDTCGPGVFTYDTSTESRPTSYGTCVCIRAGGGNWLFQVALPTAGDPLWRRNINNVGWSSWWTITSQ